MTTATALAVTAAPTILVIEDYSDTRDLLSTLLKQNGYNVVEAEDGLEGLLKAAWKDPDLILLDLSLPEMDGIAVARRLNETPGLSHIPIFVVSAYITTEVEADIRAAGCAEMFSKPFDFDSLLETISITLGQR